MHASAGFGSCAFKMSVNDGYVRPVLKHGPRSPTCTRASGWLKPKVHSESNAAMNVCSADPQWRPALEGGLERKRTRWDPKDGELCVCRVKPEETLVEARSDADVQIVRLTCV